MSTTVQLVSALGSALLDFLWQGLLVGAVAATALALLRNARPQARYLVAIGALALCVALPAATFVRTLAGPAPVATALTSAPSTPLVTRVGDATLIAEPVVSRLAPTSPAATRSAWRQWREALQPRLPMLVALWSLGASLLALRMALGLAWVAGVGGPRGVPHAAWQARLDALAERMQLPQRVLLRIVDGLESPAAARVWRPLVLVPAALVARMPTELLEALLAHELAHIRRHDYLVNLLQSLVEALLFYHPVVWWLSRRIRDEREQIADDLAAQAIGDPRRLARALAELAACNEPASIPTPTLALAAAGGTLMSRITRLLRPRRQALDWKFVLPVLGLSALCVAAVAQTAPAPNGVVAGVATSAPRSDATLVQPDTAGDAARARTQAEAERDAALAARDTEARSTFAALDSERESADAARRAEAESARFTRDSERDLADAERDARDAERDALDAQRDARDAARDAADERDGITTHGTLRVEGRGRDGDYMLVSADRDGSNLVSASLDDIERIDDLRASIGAGEFLWTRRDGRSYVLTDPALLARVHAAWAPTAPVSREMEQLGNEMEKHGEVMEAIGRRMEAQADVGQVDAEAMSKLGERMSALGMRQADLAAKLAHVSHDAAYGDEGEREAAERREEALEDEMETLERQMDALSAEMDAHGDALDRAHAPMDALGEEMDRASQPMDALGEKMDVLGEKMDALSEVAEAQTRALIEQAAREGKLRPVESLATR